MSDDRRYPYFGVPPLRQPVPAAEVGALRGKRVILSTPEGFVYDVRAVSNLRQRSDGCDVVDVVSEEEYYRWMFTGGRAIAQAYPSSLVWVE